MAGGLSSLPAASDDLAAGALPATSFADADVDGDAPYQFQIVLGPYAASALTLTDDVALEGGLFAVGALTLSDTSGLAGATDILAGTTLAASGATAEQSNVEVNGSGASLTTAGALTQANPVSDLAGGNVYVVNGASLQAGSWTVDGFVFVDATAAATVGAASTTSPKGTLSVRQGATLTLGGGASIAIDVIDAGTVAAGPNGPFLSEVVSGSLSGDGALALASEASLTIYGATSGLSAITIADGTSATGGGDLKLQAVSDVGAIAVGAYGDLNVSGALRDVGSISVGDFARASFEQVSDAGAITVGSFGELTVLGPLEDAGAISIGADGYASFLQVIDAGEIDVGQSADVNFEFDVSGSSALKITSGGTVSLEATLSGLSGVALASGAELDFIQAATDVNVPISLAGDDTVGVQDGTAVDGAVSGFDGSDVISYANQPLNMFVTGASVSASGVLSITTDALQTASLQLAGVPAGQLFLTVGVGDMLQDGQALVLLAGPSSAAPSGGAVVGGTANSFLVLTGIGAGPGLDFTGDVALLGSASTDDLTVGGQNPAGGGPGSSENALLIEPGGTVAATGMADIQSNVEVDGNGASLTVAGTLTLGGRAGSSELAAVDGGRVHLGGLDIASGTGVSIGDEMTLFIDPTGAVEVGTVGGATAGALTVDAGETVVSGAGAVLYGDVVDNGTLEAALGPSAIQVYGDVSGDGALIADASSDVSVEGDVTGLTTVGVGIQSSLEVEGDLDTTSPITTGEGSNLSVGGTGDLGALTTGSASHLSLEGGTTVRGAISIGQTASASFYGDLSTTGPLEIGQDASVSLSGYGPVSIGGTITVGETADASFYDLSATGAMEIGQGASVEIDGTVSVMPQITLDAAATLYVSGEDDRVGVTLAGGQDELILNTGAPVTGALTGFDGTDVIVNQDGEAVVAGGRIVTGASYAATGAGLGTLTLTDDGTVLDTLTIAGAYTPGEFLANAALVNDTYYGSTDVTLAGPTQTGLSGDTVTGGSGYVFDVLAGSGATAGALTFDDNVAVEGASAAAGITDDGVLDIQAGARLTSTAGASVQSGAEIDGAGALLAAQSLTLGGGYGVTDVLVVNGGAVQAASLTLYTMVGEPRVTLFVDAAGSVEVGGAAAVAGAVHVAAGSTLTDDAPIGRISAAVVDDGTISVVIPTEQYAVVPDTLEIDGALTGAGAFDVADGQGAYLAATDGLSSVVVGAQAFLESYGAIANVGTLSLGANSRVSITGDVTDAGGIDVGADATVAITGDATGAGVIAVGAGASLTIDGALSGAGALRVGAGASATIDGDVSDLSGITLDPGATLDLGADATAVPIAIVGQGVTLDIQPGASITGEITGFANGDVIRVPTGGNIAVVTTATDAGGVLTLADDGTTSATLSLTGSYAGQQFISNVAGAGGYSDVVVSSPPCFAAGTRILTARGEVAVQALRSGDEVVVLDGADRALLPVRWIGRRRIDLSRHPDPAVAQPILVRANALADGAPVRDLLVSPDHALLLDGALVAARLLVNGASVVRVTHLADILYFHVELERHAVLLADGAAAESYLDTGNRMVFSNGGECVQLHPDFTSAADLARRAARSCAELLTNPRRLKPIWRRIAERAGEPIDVIRATRASRPRLHAAGHICLPASAPTGGGASRLSFALPEGAETARLVSRAAAPSEIAPWHDDRRRLGLLVRGLTFRKSNGLVYLPLEDSRLTCGWWTVEQADGETRRWTDGDAYLPVPPRATMLEVELADVGRYPLRTRPPETACRSERPASFARRP